jgi:hypothetical protein
MNGTANGWRLS